MLHLGRADQAAEQDRQMAPLALDTRERLNWRGPVLGWRDCSQSCSALSTEVSAGGIGGVTGSATILDFGTALHAEQSVCGVVVVALRAQHRCLSTQFVEQGFGVLQVGGVEALGEPVVDLGEHCARLAAAILTLEKAGEARRCAQFQRLRVLTPGNFDRLTKTCFRLPLDTGRETFKLFEG